MEKKDKKYNPNDLSNWSKKLKITQSYYCAGCPKGIYTVKHPKIVR